MVHALEHRLDHAPEGVIAGRATEAPMFLEVVLGATAAFALHPYV